MKAVKENKQMNLKKQLDLYIEVDVLTAATTAEVVNAILETLLYQRNQIPFVYKTYQYYINKWLEQAKMHPNSNKEEGGLNNFLEQRKKQLATTTNEAICAMRETIKNTIERKHIKSLRFLFGSTAFTAKEAYTLHIPTENIAVNHYNEHHKISPGNLNQTLLSLLTSEDLYPTFSHTLNPTNVYLQLEILENHNEGVMVNDYLTNSELFPKDFSSPPGNCKNIHIHLLHKRISNIDHKCCKELKVFEDLISLNLKCNSEQEETNDKSIQSMAKSVPSWWEAEIVIRGFKDKPTKGINIWS